MVAGRVHRPRVITNPEDVELRKIENEYFWINHIKKYSQVLALAIGQSLAVQPHFQSIASVHPCVRSTYERDCQHS